MEVIRSRANALIKVIAGHTSGRSKEQLIVVEGLKNVEDAIAQGLRPERILAVDGTDAVGRGWEPLTICNRSVFDSVTTVKSPDGVLALFRVEPRPLDEIAAAPGFVVLMHSIQDPGNAGAIVRSAAAFSAGGVVFGEGCASPFSSKVARGSAGAILRVPFAVVPSTSHAIDVLRHYRRVIAAATTGGCSIEDWTPAAASVLVLGGEGSGLPQELLAKADDLLTIPISGAVESLNVAVAAGIMLHRVHVVGPIDQMSCGDAES